MFLIEFFFSFLTQSNLSADTAPKQPINIGTINIQSSQFIQNLTPLQNQISKQVIPSGCQRLKDELRKTERLFENQIARDEKSARFVLATSKLSQSDKDDYSSKLTEATKKAREDINNLSIKLLKEIVDKCKTLTDGSIVALSDVEKQLQNVASMQKSIAEKFAELPTTFNKQMQDAYLPVDTLLNS